MRGSIDMILYELKCAGDHSFEGWFRNSDGYEEQLAAGEIACPVCGDTVREVSFADSSLQYCATCQTGGKPLADRRMSKLLK